MNNRPIKFRAWSITGKCMYSWEQITANRGSLYKFFLWPDVYELMQFTGLFDRLGVEIYEGDIFIGFCKTKTPYIVKYGEDASFYGETVPHNGVSGAGKQTVSLLNAPQWLEVLGNIYEHQHLLQKVR